MRERLVFSSIQLFLPLVLQPDRRSIYMQSDCTDSSPFVFCTKHNGRQLGSKVFICNKLDVSKHPRSTLQHVMLNAAAMYRPVQCPAVNIQYYMIYYYISL